MIILFQSRKDIMRLVRSEIVQSMKKTVTGVGGLSAFGYKGYYSYQLYVSTWDFVFINELNETIGIANRRSLWNQDFIGHTDDHEVKPFSTAYVRLQPLLNAVWEYTYHMSISRKNKYILIPTDLSSQTCKTFLITKEGLQLAPELYYRQWTPDDSKTAMTVFQT